MHLGRIREGRCWVAVDEDDIPVGFLSAEMVVERELHIHEMSVASMFQGRILGRTLIQTAVEWAATKHLAALTLTTFLDVPWNAPFYSRLVRRFLGTTPIGDVPKWLRDSEFRSTNRVGFTESLY